MVPEHRGYPKMCKISAAEGWGRKEGGKEERREKEEELKKRVWREKTTGEMTEGGAGC